MNPVSKIKGRLPKIRTPHVNPSLNFESAPPKQTVQAWRKEIWELMKQERKTVNFLVMMIVFRRILRKKLFYDAEIWKDRQNKNGHEKKCAEEDGIDPFALGF